MVSAGRLVTFSLGLLLVAVAATPSPAADKPWAFRAPVRSAVPTVKGQVLNPIDSFLLAKLEASGLTFSPEADRRTLIRRLSFDLTGLPPAPAEVETFVNDTAPDAYEKLVDRLLASPHHGERWATAWLDLARYAESDGFKADDARPAAWRYRDYVIRALNDDRPYDRFLREQLAGDELYPDDPEALIATGFNRHFPDEYNAVNLEQRRQEILNDITDTTAQVVLGLTVGCARCHDHKFDPISQEDYYRVQAFFAAYQPADLPAGRHDEMEHYRAELRAWEARTADVRKRIGELEEPYRKRFLDSRKKRFSEEYQAMFDLAPEKRTPLQQQIAFMVEKQVRANSDEVVKSMKPEVRQQWQDLQKQMTETAHDRPPAPPTAMALTDVGPVAPATHLLRRGDWRHPGKEVAPGFLSALDDRPAQLSAPKPGAATTGRRVVLARWLTADDNPLTARVMVNRLWQGHFGRGIVATAGDFGVQGEPPTHPELLDWLATEFVARGWSMKQMHRLIVTSAAYRQDSSFRETMNRTGVDPDNRLLWHQNRRRLEGEALRDAMLSVSGLLNRKAGGRSVYPELPEELSATPGWRVTAEPAERNRRSVYVYAKRNQRFPLFSTFDAPDANETCARRYATTTAPQALMLLNARGTLDVAKAFAERVLAESGGDPAKVIDCAHSVALGRPPDADERATLLAFLDRQTALLKGKKKAAVPARVDPAFVAAVADLCHALLNVNEFLYVD
jgi:Protein of unknown function (DUF1553)/Protein of unknown function (DUF1549)